MSFSASGEWKSGKRHGQGVMMSVIGGETVVVDAMWNKGKIVDEEY